MGYMYKKINILLFLLFFHVSSYAFNTIDQAWTYAQTLQEYPDTSMRDWTNPDYTAYHYSIKPNFLKKTLEWLHLYKPYFSIKATNDLIKKITKARELNGYFDRFIQKIIPQDGEQFFLFSDLNGAFHSFLRDLLYLKNSGIISNDFALKKGCYIIFNGNVADKSPYILETLHIICTLFLKNPEQIIYIRGNIEDKEGWLGKTLEYELTGRAKNFSQQQIPLESTINRFFNTLPLALFLTSEINNTIVTIRFSNSGLSQKELQSKDIDLFLQSEKIKEHFKLKDTYEKKPVAIKKVRIAAFFILEDRKKSYHPNKGLIHLDDEEGIMSFATISSPIDTNRRLYDFFYDAFIQIVIGKNILDSQLNLFYQDVREQNGFSKEIEPFISSIETSSLAKAVKDTPVSKEKVKNTQEVVETENRGKKEISSEKKPFVFGCTLDLTRGLSHVTAQHRKGILAAAQRYEKEHNQDIKVIFKDDQYMPEHAKENVDEFLKEGIDIILEPYGSPTTQSYLNLAKEKKILILFPTTGAPIFRDKNIPYIVNLRCSYVTEGAILLQRALAPNPNKIAVFYQNDAFGKGGLEGVLQLAQEKKIPEDRIIKIPYERNSVDFALQVEQIKKTNPDTIIMIAISTAAREFIRLFNVEFFRGKAIFGVSDLSEKSFLDMAKEKNVRTETLSTTPSIYGSSDIAKNFRQDAEKEKIELDTFAFESYIGASIAFDGLSKIKDEADLKTALLTKIESYQHYNFGGLDLTFNSEARDLGFGIWLYSNEKEWELLKNPLETSTKKQESQKNQEEHTRIESIKTEKEISEKPIEKIESSSVKTLEDRPTQETKRLLSVGCTMDLSRGIHSANDQQKNGMLAALQRFGTTPGCNWDLKIIFKDDKYNPATTLEYAENFIKEGINIILSPSGSPTTVNLLNLVKDKKLMLLFPTTGALDIRKAELTYILNLRPCGCTEAKAIISQALNTYNAKKIVIFYQNDAFGRGALSGIEEYEKEHKISDNTFIKVAYGANDVNFSSQVQKIKESGADTLIFLASAIAATGLVRELGVGYFPGKTVFGLSELAKKAFLDFAKEKGLRFIYTSILPDPESDIEIARMFVEDAKHHNFTPDVGAFEGYLDVALFCNILKQVKTDTTNLQEDIIKTFESYKNYNFYGVNLTFNPTMRDVSLNVWLYDLNTWKEIKEIK